MVRARAMEKRSREWRRARQGIGHVEVILAFLLFIAAVLFIFSFVEFRGGSSEKHDATLSYLTNYLATNLSVPVESYSVIISDANAPLALAIALPEDIRSEQHIRVENEKGEKKAARKHPTDAKQIIVQRATVEERFLRIVISEAIALPEDSSLSVPPLWDSTKPLPYQIASHTSNRMLAESKLQAFAERYSGEYDVLRQELGLQQTHFGLRVGPLGRDFINAQNSIPARADVRAQNLRQSVLRTDGARAFADVVVKVW